MKTPSNRPLCLVLFVACSLLFSACTTSGDPKPKKSKDVLTNQLGYVLPKFHFSIDGYYDARTANMMPGYTALTVAVANKGFQNIAMRPDKDVWRVKERGGKWHKAILDIQYQEPEYWQRLSPRAQQLILYPTEVPPGYTQTFQLFVPGKVNLAGFDAIKYRSGNAKKTFTFTRY